MDMKMPWTFHAFLPALLLFVMTSTRLEAQHWCLTTASSERSTQEDSFNQFVNAFKAGGGHHTTDLKVIPLIIHVIWRTPEDSLIMNTERIQSQIEASNLELRRLNPDASNTRPQFHAVAADCQILVCRATRLPSGTPFNGVLYYHVPGFSFFEHLSDIMTTTIVDPDRYLNVWVVPDHEGGAAVFPWDREPDRDGFWVGARWFGTIGSDLSEFMNEGSTFTHELAHYLGVYHTFHNSFMFLGQCDLADDPDVGDLCGDTPLDWTLPFTAEQCDPGYLFCEEPELELVAQTENFMFYNQDSCTNMFTRDQRARMRACLSGIRSELVSEENHAYTGVQCAPLTSLTPQRPVAALRLFPNPARERVFVDLSGDGFEGGFLRITDSMGNAMGLFSSAAMTEGVDISGWPAGLYFLTLFSQGRMLETLPLVVMK